MKENNTNRKCLSEKIPERRGVKTISSNYVSNLEDQQQMTINNDNSVDINLKILVKK